jgi:hypothetical protein
MILNVKAAASIKKFVSKYLLDIVLFSLVLFLLGAMREWELEKEKSRCLSSQSAKSYP